MFEILKIHKMKTKMHQHMMPKDIRPIRADLAVDFKGVTIISKVGP